MPPIYSRIIFLAGNLFYEFVGAVFILQRFLSNDFLFSEAIINTCELSVILTNLAYSLENTAVINIAKLFGYLLKG